MKGKKLGIILIPTVLALGIVAGMFIGIYTGKKTSSPQEEKLKMILGIIQQQYVDKIDIDSLMEKTYPGLLMSLDPHSSYIPASDLQAVNDELESSFSGIGVSFQLINDSVNVIEVIPGGPAEKIGVIPGDIILSADGKKLTGSGGTAEDVFKALRGEKGTTVSVEVKRSNSAKPLKFDIERDMIPSLSVDCAYQIEPGIGYIRVNKFARTTYSEFVNALNKLKREGAEKYIVDLRGNSGGFMDQVVYMANEFLPENKSIVYTKGRYADSQVTEFSDGSGQFIDNELIILTNEYSASASEIFAGAIQDNDRGLIIGRRSFGKGLVQNQIALPDGSAIRLTIARYFTPSGRLIQKDYSRGTGNEYDLDIIDRYTRGEFYSKDSIKFDKTKLFHTSGGRPVYGGGGIMPDIFIPEDTTGYTSYLIDAINKGHIQKFAYNMANKYRKLIGEKGNRSEKELIDAVMRIIPRDNTLLHNFAEYAAANGLPARWYYINRSRDILLNQLKAVIVRDLVGYSGYLQILNQQDSAVQRAVDELKKGNSKVNLVSGNS